MHVALLSSQSFLTPACRVSGTIEADQGLALKGLGAEVGVVAVKADQSVLRSVLLRSMPAISPRTYVGERAGFPIVERRVLPLRHGRWEKRAKYWVAAARVAFDRYVAEYGRPDVVHAHFARYAGLAASSIYREHDVPYVLTEHGSAWVSGEIADDEATLLRRAFTDAGRVIAVSDYLGAALVKRGVADEFIVVPNVVNSRFAAVEDPPEVPPFQFLAVGALRPIKAHDLLIRSFGEAFHERPDVRLRIVGSGNEFAHLETLIVSLGLTDQIELVGGLAKEDIPAEMARAHAFVHTSRHETFGVAVAEALTAGRPVVSTACGGPESIIEQGDGMLVPVGDKQALARAMVQLAEGQDAGRCARRERALHRFGMAQVGRRLQDVLNEVARTKRYR